MKGAPTVKDPNAPRRPTTAYLLFCQQNRDKLRAANPGMAFLDVTKELGQQWTQLDEEERQVHCYINTIMLYTLQHSNTTILTCVVSSDVLVMCVL